MFTFICRNLGLKSKWNFLEISLAFLEQETIITGRKVRFLSFFERWEVVSYLKIP